MRDIPRNKKKLNAMKSSEILKAIKGTNFIVRVYSDGEICVMEDNDRADGSSFAVLTEKNSIGQFADYIDENHQKQIDECGDEFVEWKNEDFETPYEADDIEERIQYYERFNN
jgi:hypothetical protein